MSIYTRMLRKNWKSVDIASIFRNLLIIGHALSMKQTQETASIQIFPKQSISKSLQTYPK